MNHLSALLRIGAALVGALVAPIAQAHESDEMIWPRIAAGMRIVDEEQPETVTWARYYARNPEQFSQMLARSEPFLWYIVEAVELRDMPLEIALVPAVESGFDPSARSSRKARGLWQFLPSTGRSYGLHESVNFDGRRDIATSTTAGLAYLQRLNRHYDDWLLAIAAYNVGDGNLDNAIADAGSQNFWDLDLPKETREHVPRVLGVALLIKQPQRFGVVLPHMLNKPTAEIIKLDSPKDLAMATAHAGISRQTMERYNPGLKTLSNSKGKHVLLLPHDEAVKMRRELAHRDYKPKTSKHTEHIIAAGDSLWVIAREYNVSVAQLREWNNLDEHSKLRLGRKLVVQQT